LLLFLHLFYDIFPMAVLVSDFDLTMIDFGGVGVLVEVPVVARNCVSAVLAA
jgi:hypothetical protein